MTAQIILNNQLGVAIASDTMATSGSKTLPVVSKIIALPDPHRVAVLISNMVFIGPAHARLLVTEWAKSLSKAFDSISEYSADFSLWVGRNAGRFGLDDLTMIASCVRTELVELLQAGDTGSARFQPAFEAAAKDGSIDPTVFEGEAVKIVDAYCNGKFKEDQFSDLDGAKVQQLISGSGFNPDDEIATFIEQGLGLKPADVPGLAKRLEPFIEELLRRWVPSASLTYLNFAGSGVEEFFPGHVQLAIRSVYGGSVRAQVTGNIPKVPNEIYPWVLMAQQDAMADLLRGASSERRATFLDMALDLIDANEDLQEDFKFKFGQDLVTKIEQYFNEHFEQPQVSTIEGLSVPSLVTYAEMLVKIQSLRSATQFGPTSVGGMVECLAISRDRGVEWRRQLSNTDDRQRSDSSVLG